MADAENPAQQDHNIYTHLLHNVDLSDHRTLALMMADLTPSVREMARRPHEKDLMGAAYDSTEGRVAERKLIICSAPRSGSYELCRLLTAAGIGTPHEYFNPRNAKQAALRWGLKADPLSKEGIETYIASLLTRRVQNGVFATKLLFRQYRKHLQNSIGSGFLKDAAFVHLYRPDVIRQFSSLRASQISGRWDYSERNSTTPQTDSIEAALRSLESLVGADAGFRKLFVLVGKTPLFITTDEVVNEPRETVQRIAQFVGVAPDLSALNQAVVVSKAYERNLQIEKQAEATIETLRRRWLLGNHSQEIEKEETRRRAIGTLRRSIRTIKQQLSQARRELKRLADKPLSD